MIVPHDSLFEPERWSVLWRATSMKEIQVPWEYKEDTMTDELHRLSLEMADIAKQADTLHASAVARRDILHKQLRGQIDGGLAPDITKAAPKRSASPDAYKEQEMIRHMVTAYPNDVRPVEDLHAAQESRKAELTKAVKPDAPPMANAPMPDSSEDLAKFIVGRGLVVAPDVKKEMSDIRALPGHAGGDSGAPDFGSGMTEPNGGAKKREAKFVQGAGKGEASMFVDEINAQRTKLINEVAMLKDLQRLGEEKSVSADDIEYSVNLAIKSGSLSHSKSLQAIAETPGFSASLRDLARTAAQRARRNEASQRGEPFLERGYFD